MWLLWEIHLKATEHHLPCGIIQCYLPLDVGERVLPQTQPDRLVLDLLNPEGWKAELTLVLVIYQDGLSVRILSRIQGVVTTC